MVIRRQPDIRSSEITDQKLYIGRRQFMRAAAGTAVAAASGIVGSEASASLQEAPHKGKLPNVQKSPLSVLGPTDKINTWEHITTYNNFYEFGTDKEDPAANARKFKAEPWAVTVDGECDKPAKWQLEDILKDQTLEERVYRHRCVEAWSMVIPWVGFPLSAFLKRCEPKSTAKFVEFTTIYDPGQMSGQRSQILNWPYKEGLRMDEAMHPLAIFAVGLYGEVLPNQNGAPLRLVVPWKYGFKSIKSIIRIHFTDKQPLNTWQWMAPSEYGFYANVNPTVDHPRWSQASERRIGEGFFKRKTLMFNGYGDQVAQLYTGLNLNRNF